VPSRFADARRIVTLLDRLLGAGARIAIITGTSFENVAAQIGTKIAREHASRLFVCTNRGSEAFGFDRRGAPVLLYRRVANAEEERLLDAIANGVRDRLERLTRLRFEVIRSRLNRRKIDLIPEHEDPPKSAMGELLAATEARLRRAGLRDGVREAFVMTEILARELGLPNARVTSDVKHVEVGLTDKADAMSFVVREIAEPLSIAPRDMLLAGDEFGPIAGFEGSDHRMLAAPGVDGAVVVSVGPEPAGAPARVIHLGGGPLRFCELIASQVAIDEHAGPFTPPRDAAWVIEEAGFDVAREHEIESLLSFANGYVGSRGSLAEGTRASRPATFLAGAFEPSADISRVPELVIAPDWGRLRFVIEGEPASIESGEMQHHRRMLDMRRGLLLREGTERGSSGHLTEIRTVHAASLANRHLLLEGVELEPHNYSGTVRVQAILSGDVKSESGASHWATFEPCCAGVGPTLVGRTRGGLVLALASHLQLEPDGIAEVVRETTETSASERVDIAAKLGLKRALYRTVALASSRDSADPLATVTMLSAEARTEPFEAHVARHEAAWGERWRRAAVHIDGAPALERALRFAQYHLIAAANPDDPRCSIGARSLSGQAYRGHVFWDTETFMLPFFAYTYPEAARTLLEYRHRTLNAALRKAARYGHCGALYAWESADTGDETTPAAILSPFGEILRVLSGEQEHHISADIAYAVSLYAEASGDDVFLTGPGADILVQTARFWASRVELGDDGLFHIRCVIGPDEYHESIDDNAFTNWMARFNLVRAARVVDGHPEVAARLGVTDDERASWRRIAGAMYLGLDPSTGIIEQFTGFFGLEPIDLAELGPRHAPADFVLGRTRTQNSQVIKQADVVMLLALLWDEVPDDVRRASFAYYEPRTAHGSSLSPGTHALVAARLGLYEVAARYLRQTAAIDLGNTMGNAAGGVHAAALGSLWQAIVFGVAGVRPVAGRHDGGRPPKPPAAGAGSGCATNLRDALLIEPHLLPEWRSLEVRLVFRKRLLTLVVDHSSVEVAVVEGDEPLVVRAAGLRANTVDVRVEPGTRHALRNEGGGDRAWERIS
jgi:kojibiose phosphorylase